MRRILGLARHAVHANLSMPFTRAGAALVAGVVLLGAILSLTREGRWALDADLLGTGLAFGAIFVIRSGLVEQRMGGLQDFLRVNFVTPLEHMAASVLSLVAAWLALGAWTWLVGVVVSLGDIGTVSWTVWVTMLVLGILLPFTLMIECVTDLRTPFVIPGFVWVAGLLTLGVTIGTQETITLLGLNTDPAWFPSSYPLVRRTLVTLALGFALVLAGTAIRGRARRRRELAARESVR